MKITDRIKNKLPEVKSCVYHYNEMKLSIIYKLNESNNLAELNRKVAKIVSDIQLQDSIKRYDYIELEGTK